MKAILIATLVIYAVLGLLFALLMLLLDLIDRSKRTPVAVAVVGFVMRVILWLPMLMVAFILGRKSK